MLIASPIAVAALSYVGETWYPVGDWASMAFRTDQVGTLDTPLVGPYTVKGGWAHPGPFLYWAAAPLYHLTGGDPRSLLWTAGLVNAVAVAAIVAVAWRRGRWPWLVAVSVTLALLVHGIGVGRLIDLWNPFLGLLPFFLAVLLAVDVALGRPRSLVPAAVAASIAVQCHVAYGALSVLVLLWLVGWSRWWRRSLAPGSEADPGPLDVRPPERSWSAWRPSVRTALGVVTVLWLPPLVDLVLGIHNLARVGAHVVLGLGDQHGDKIGITHGGSLVSRYVRPDGPWMGGGEPQVFLDVQGSGPVPVVLVLVLLGGCLLVARRRRILDVAALVTLSGLLVVASVPVAGTMVGPAYAYLTQWLKIVGALVWLTVGWTAWRLAEPALRAPAGRRRAVAAVAGAAVVTATAASWGEAARLDPPVGYEGGVVQELRARVREDLPREGRYRVEHRGDEHGHVGPGLIYYMIEDGYDVVTSDGRVGLKWGPDHAWERGDPVDAVLTVAVVYPGIFRDAYSACLEDPDVELVASYGQLTPDERRDLEDLRLRLVSDEEEDQLTDAEERRRLRLEEDSFRVGVFAGDSVCGRQRAERD